MTFTSLYDFFLKSGYTIFILLICSIISIKVIVEKYIQLKSLNTKFNQTYIKRINNRLRKDDIDGAKEELELNNSKWLIFNIKSPLKDILSFIIMSEEKDKDILLDRAFIKLDVAMVNLDKGLNILATLGGISPFIGLLGTVIGIIKAFESLAGDLSFGYGNVMAGIAEALIATAAGLMVAIPAVFFYNTFTKKIKNAMPLFEDAIYEITSNLYKAKKEFV